MKNKLCLLTIAASTLLPLQISSAQVTVADTPAAVKEIKKDTPDSLTDELLTIFKKLPGVLDQVTDQASAEAAAKKIDELGVQVGKIAKRLEPLPEPSDEVKERIDAKMTKETKALGEDLAASMQQMMGNPDAMAIIATAMQKFGKDMAVHEATFKKFGKNSKKKDGGAAEE